MEIEGSAGERSGYEPIITNSVRYTSTPATPWSSFWFSKGLLQRLDYGSRVQSPCRIWSHDCSECLERPGHRRNGLATSTSSFPLPESWQHQSNFRMLSRDNSKTQLHNGLNCCSHAHSTSIAIAQLRKYRRLAQWLFFKQLLLSIMCTNPALTWLLEQDVTLVDNDVNNYMLLCITSGLSIFRFVLECSYWVLFTTCSCVARSWLSFYLSVTVWELLYSADNGRMRYYHDVISVYSLNSWKLSGHFSYSLRARLGDTGPSPTTTGTENNR